MATTVTQAKSIHISPEIEEHFAIKLGHRFDWRWTGKQDGILVRVMPECGADGGYLQYAGYATRSLIIQLLNLSYWGNLAYDCTPHFLRL